MIDVLRIRYNLYILQLCLISHSRPICFTGNMIFNSFIILMVLCQFIQKSLIPSISESFCPHNEHMLHTCSLFLHLIFSAASLHHYLSGIPFHAAFKIFRCRFFFNPCHHFIFLKYQNHHFHWKRFPNLGQKQYIVILVLSLSKYPCSPIQHSILHLSSRENRYSDRSFPRFPRIVRIPVFKL